MAKFDVTGVNDAPAHLAENDQKPRKGGLSEYWSRFLKTCIKPYQGLKQGYDIYILQKPAQLTVWALSN